MSLPRFFDSVYWSVRFQRVDDPTLDAVRTAAAGVVIEVRATDAAAHDPGCAAGLELLVNLLARTFGSLALNVEPGLRGRLVRLATAINPGVDLAPKHRTLVVAWGGTPPEGVAVWAGGDGWTASVCRTHAVGASPNRAAGLVAGVLAYTELFKLAFGPFLGSAWEPTTEAHLSLLTHEVSTAPAPDPVPFPVSANLGEVHLVGVGAVGFAFLAALRTFPRLLGHIHVIDNQKVDLSNLQRYVLAYDADVLLQAKVNVAQRELKATKLTITPHGSTWERYVADQPPAWRFRRIVTALDSARARQHVQAALPREVFNAGVTRSVFDVARYGFDGVHECLNCAYQRAPGPPLFDLMLRTFGLSPARLQQLEDHHLALTVEDVRVIEAHVRRPGQLRLLVGLSLSAAYMRMCGYVIAEELMGANEPALVPAAHVPVLAGVLLAVEILKASAPELAPYRIDHVLQFDTRYGLDTTIRLRQGPLLVAAPCICQDPDYQRSYGDKWPG